MAKSIILCIAVSVFPYTVFSQSEGNITVMDTGINPGTVIVETLPPAPVREGQVYLFEDWKKSRIRFRKGKSEVSYPVNFNLETGNLEIKVGKEVKLCPLSAFEFFITQDTDGKYIGITTGPDGEKYKGLFELLWQDKVSLLGYNYIDIKDPSYVPAFDTGNRNIQIVKKQDFYLMDDKGVLKRIYKSKNKNKDVFGELYNDILDFSKKNKLRFNDGNDLIRIIAHYNDLK